MKLRAIEDVGADLGLGAGDLTSYGPGVAKLEAPAVARLRARPPGRLVLVSAVNPTRAGEGKTTVSIGLGQGLRLLGVRSAVALREPSLGPVFGAKGGGTGGGRTRLEPSARINLHFTGDLHAITAAHDLLAALVDNAIYFGDPGAPDPRQVSWRRVLDVDDRFLRQTIVGLGGRAHGVPREAGFDITAASEVMAILCLADGIPDLKARLGRVIVGADRDGRPVTAGQLGAVGPMAALLHDAIRPNLVQTTEGVPAIVHGGPFGNIAHGCSSVIGTRTALGGADVVVTEAGFGFDLGAEKFFDIKCRSSGLWPHAVVMVVTARALAAHGGGDLRRGLAHLDHHVASARAFGFDPVVAVNVFAGDAETELAAIERACTERGLRAARVHGFTAGGAGCVELGHAVLAACDRPAPPPRFLYPLEAAPEEKIAAVARTVYGAREVELGREARADLERVRALGLERLPICIAKTHLALGDDPRATGRPERIYVRGVRPAAGAGYLLVVAGDVVTMPGLPRRPAARDIDLTEDGEVTGVE